MTFEVKHGSRILKINVEEMGDRYVVTVDGTRKLYVNASSLGPCLSLIIDGKSYDAAVALKDSSHYSVNLEGEQYSFEVLSEARKVRRFLKRTKPVDSHLIQSKMPGKIVKILAKEGDKIAIDQGVIIMEAMKMENELKSPQDGRISEIRVKEGDTVEAGAVLVVLEP